MTRPKHLSDTRTWTVYSLLLASLALVSIPAAGDTVVFQFLGNGELVDIADVPRSGDVPQVPSDALCYKVPIVDPEAGLRIGTGFDCLWNIVANDTLTEITLTDTAFFRFLGGSFISEGSVEIRAANAGNGTTHITGGFPAGNNILKGRGAHSGLTGSVRVSGAVDMSQFPDTIGFDCLFVVDMD